MSSEFPRTLIVSPSTFNSYTGTGILLSNLFRGWPIDRIASIYSEDRLPDHDRCRLAYRLGDKELRFLWPFSMLRKRAKPEVDACDRVRPAGSSRYSCSLRSKNFTREFIETALRLLGIREIISRRYVSSKLLEWIKDFDPELIYAHISTLEGVYFVGKIATLTRTPFSLHVMDDWLQVRSRGGLLSPFFRLYFEKCFRDFVRNASLRMAIGKKMADAYEDKFGYPFLPFPNILEPAEWMNQKREVKRSTKTFQVVYAGTINDKNINGLKRFRDIVARLFREGSNVEFCICTFYPRSVIYKPVLENRPSVLVKEAPVGDEMIGLLKNADLLFLPVDFTAECIYRMRFSIFAKLPAYLMSGTPVLVNGPAEVASVEYALKNESAYVVTEDNSDSLETALLKLMRDEGLRNRLVANAKKAALRDFDASKVRPRFRDALRRASLGA